MKGAERPEIDGLRAFAILPVLLFHAGLGCPGGYAGVDIFFVISGFLIGGIILRELDAGTFSFAGFWERRTRRILPALLGLFAATLFFGWLMLPPLDLASLGEQTTAALSGMANFKMLAITHGYWAKPAGSVLLLHTWSLAVEEQFYLLMPVLLVLARRRAVRGPFLTMLGLFAVSLSLSLYWSADRYAGNFYLLPSRAWELLLGALGAWSVQQRLVFPKAAMTWAPPAGLLMILGSVFFLGSDSGWPDAKTLIPTIGTWLILISPQAEDRPSLIFRILSIPPVRYVGLISYSLYLWHWPLMVLVKTYAADELTNFNRWQLVTASFALAAASWFFIEQPFRNRAWWFRVGTKPFLLGTVGVWLCLMAASQMVAKNPGREGEKGLVAESLQQPGQLVNYDVTRSQLENGGIQFNAANKTPRCILLGSSHGMTLGPVIQALSDKYQIPCALFCQNAFTPLFAAPNNMQMGNGRQLRRDEIVKKYIAQWKPEVVIIADRWGLRVVGSNSLNFESSFSNTVQWLEQHVSQVVVVGQVPELPGVGMDISIFIQRKYRRNGGTLPQLAEPPEVTQARHRALALFQTYSNITVIDPDSVFQNTNQTVRYFNGHHILYGDNNHLNPFGSMELEPALEPLFKEMTGR
jgi:peptidoglycan/LPS O-acetylase OafA/YrhL